MEKTKKRALRRAHLRRMKEKAERIFVPSGMSAANAHHMANHLKICSCAICGNPRRYAKGQERFTIQERRGSPAFEPGS